MALYQRVSCGLSNYAKAHKIQRIVISATIRWWSPPSPSRRGHLIITLGVYHSLIDKRRAQATCNYLCEDAFLQIFVTLVAGAEPWTQRSLRTVDDLIIPLRILLSVILYISVVYKKDGVIKTYPNACSVLTGLVL